MFHTRCGRYAFVSCGLLSASSLVLGGLVGVDAIHAQDGASQLANSALFDEYRSIITDAGHTIVPLTTFNSSTLGGLRAIILTQPYEAPGYSADEIDAVHGFVASGGGLLVHAEGGSGSEGGIGSLNTLAHRYGVTFWTGEPTDGGGRAIDGFVAHPVTVGVATAGVDFQRPLVQVVAPAIDLTSGGGGDNILAAVTGAGGAGNVVLTSDRSNFSDSDVVQADYHIGSLDNRRLLRNIVDFITVPEPTLVPLVLGAMLLRIRRRDRHPSRDEVV